MVCTDHLGLDGEARVLGLFESVCGARHGLQREQSGLAQLWVGSG
jgi:hypothetical protein